MKKTGNIVRPQTPPGSQTSEKKKKEPRGKIHTSGEVNFSRSKKTQGGD
jgi:hypothetical protein